jgi:mycofactocin precursor
VASDAIIVCSSQALDAIIIAEDGMTDPRNTVQEQDDAQVEDLVGEDLIEEVSIDGMCGVY